MKRKFRWLCCLLMALFAAWLIHWCWISADRWASQPVANMKIGDVFFMLMWAVGVYYVCHGRK